MEAASRLNPEVIVTDIGLPLLNGIDAARQIKKDQPDAKILFLTMHKNLTYLRDALATGASGYVLKTHLKELFSYGRGTGRRSDIHVSLAFGEGWQINSGAITSPLPPAPHVILLPGGNEILQQWREEARKTERKSGVTTKYCTQKTVAFHKHPDHG